eukprot:TRINITY_DN886_c0_g1_i11.p1 TRINITY_DN886_c0_g1~~TRINITY_DN886_c0_g1_i11.p1  ORF type:complete len:203 (+),score=22.84 TRINITY_DN886_c0_g1_i11:594-1202(+)
MNFLGLKAMLSLLKSDLKDAFHMALEADVLLEDKTREPTAFFTFPAYMAIPEVYLRLLLRPKFWDPLGTSKKKLLKKFKASMQPLQLFAKTFKFAWPRIHLLEGLAVLAEGAPLQDAVGHWEMGLKSAQHLEMAAELATLERHLAQAVTKETASILLTSSLLVLHADTNSPQHSQHSSRRPVKDRRAGKNKDKDAESSVANV